MENITNNRADIINMVNVLAEKWKEKVHHHYRTNFPNLPLPGVRVNIGGRYIGVFRGEPGVSESIAFFVDMTGGKIGKHPSKAGDILKPAGRNVPAPHARGSIFENDLGLSKLSEYGAAYLR